MRKDADDFGGAITPAVQPPGPLFERIEGPFSRSSIQPSKRELMVGSIIWRHQGHKNPVSIKRIIALAGMSGLNDREVKDVVAELVLTHRCRIGSKRDDPAGYFWIVDAEDERVAIAQYRAQLIQMGRRLRVLASDEQYLEAVGQLRMREES